MALALSSTPRSRPSAQSEAIAALARVLSDGQADFHVREQPELMPQPGQQRVFTESNADVVVYGGQAGGGKMLALATPIPTPSGWTTMGELAAGDLVFGADGSPVVVAQAHPVTIPSIAYRLTFDDGETVDACADHLWRTFTARDLASILTRSDEWRARRRATRGSRATGRRSARFVSSISERNSARVAEHQVAPVLGAIRTTQDIADSLRVGRSGRANHAVPVCSPIDLPAADLPLDPYLLGVWLGDGTREAGAITTADDEIVAAFTMGGFTATRWLSSKYGHGIHGLSSCLRAAGVFSRKHVPAAYLRASQGQRLALLQGLMDTDGCSCESGSVEFTSTSRDLADAVAELACSLGSKARVNEGLATLYGKDCGPKYRVKWTAAYPAFRLSRKLDRQKVSGERRTTRFRYITGCERIEPVPMRCITVANEDGLFLCSRSFIPTHNSYGLLIAAARHVREPGYSAVIFRRTLSQVIKPGGLWDQAMRVYPLSGGEPRSSKHSFTWPSGATVTFAHLEYESSKLEWQGAQLEFIGFDELTHFTEGQFWYLFSRARSKVIGLKPVIRATCNPDPDSFVADLLMDRWISRETGLPKETMRNRRLHFARDGERLLWSDEPGELRRLTDREPQSMQFIPAALTDNPAGMAADPGYGAMLDALSMVDRERLKHGNWIARPTAGRVFSRAWFHLVGAVPAEGREVRYWDKAGTEGGGCRSAGVRMKRTGGRYTVTDVVTAQHEAARREALIRQTAELDGRGVEVVVEQEPGSGGKESAQGTVRSLSGWRVYADRVTGAKLSRWLPLAAQAEAGNVDVLDAEWTRGFLDDLHNADGERPKRVDTVDAAAGAFAWLTKSRLTTGIG